MGLTPEQQSKIDSFSWNDSCEDKDAKPQPQMATCDEILECAEKVSEYVVENIDLMDLQQDLYSVDVPMETHSLLGTRFDSQWTEYSRSRVFDFIRAVFVQKMDDLGYVEQIENKIREVFPRKGAIIRINNIDFFDEPEVDVSVTERTLNLTEGSEAVKKTRSYNFSGNTITVELKIDIVDDIPEGFTPGFIV